MWNGNGINKIDAHWKKWNGMKQRRKRTQTKTGVQSREEESEDPEEEMLNGGTDDGNCTSESMEELVPSVMTSLNGNVTVISFSSACLKNDDIDKRMSFRVQSMTGVH